MATTKIETETLFTEAPTLDSLATSRRPHEVFTAVTSFEPWQRCQHGKQIVIVRVHWSDDAPFVLTEGHANSTLWFTRTIHADGSSPADYGYEYNTVSRCPKCQTLNTLSTKQLAYGDETTCSADGCDYEHYRSIGD